MPSKEKTIYKMKQLERARNVASPRVQRSDSAKVPEEGGTPSPSLRKPVSARAEQTQAEDSDAGSVCCYVT